MGYVGIEIAKQKSKGAPRAGDAKDRESLPKEATKAFQTNPANGKGSSLRGTENPKGKLGK